MGLIPDGEWRISALVTSVRGALVSGHAFRVRRAQEERYRRLSRGGCFVVLGIAIAFLIAAANAGTIS